MLVLAVISVSIFVLFWYGPRSPAQGLCDRRTNNRCTDEFLADLEQSLGYINPMLSEFGKYVGGIFAGREIDLGNTTVECAAPCLGLSYSTFVPVFDETRRRLPATVSLAVGALGDHPARRGHLGRHGGPPARHRGRQGHWSARR